MTDLTKIEKPLGLLTPEEQKALVEWPYGLIVFVGSGWVDRAHSFLPFLDYSKVHRAKPAPVTKPSVDWSAYRPGYEPEGRE